MDARPCDVNRHSTYQEPIKNTVKPVCDNDKLQPVIHSGYPAGCVSCCFFLFLKRTYHWHITTVTNLNSKWTHD